MILSKSEPKFNVTQLKLRNHKMFIVGWAMGTVFPQIVSSLEYFPPLNSFLTPVRKLFKFSLHKRKTNAETI